MKQIIGPIIIITLAISAVSAQAADQDVRRHGAKGDGVTMDSAAFQKAIDEASAGGGGVVRVPPGKYLIANVALKSNVTLRLDKGATLLGSTDSKDYPNVTTPSILTAKDAEHVGIEG